MAMETDCKFIKLTNFSSSNTLPSRIQFCSRCDRSILCKSKRYKSQLQQILTKHQKNPALSSIFSSAPMVSHSEVTADTSDSELFGESGVLCFRDCLILCRQGLVLTGQTKKHNKKCKRFYAGKNCASLRIEFTHT